MKRLLASFATLSLLAAPTLAAPIAVGTPVVDTKEQPVGTVAAVEGESVVTVRTDKHDVRLPVASFANQDGKLYLALSQAELNAKYETDQAAIAASLEIGKPVKGTNGTVLGTVESKDEAGVVIKLVSGKTIKVPSNGIAGGVDGAVVGITAEQLEAQLGASTTTGS